MKDKNKTYLGYFSGSRTHNDDFSVIIPVLSKLMKEDENIYLKIVGCLELDKRLFEFEKE